MMAGGIGTQLSFCIEVLKREVRIFQSLLPALSSRRRESPATHFWIRKDGSRWSSSQSELRSCVLSHRPSFPCFRIWHLISWLTQGL